MIEAEAFYGLEWMAFSATLLSFIRTLNVYYSKTYISLVRFRQNLSCMAKQTHLLFTF